MAASQASIAASRLLNLRIPAFQALLHRHPSVALSVQPTATTPNQSLNLFHPQNDSPDNSSTASFRASNLPLNFPLPLGFRGMQIEAAGKASTPKDDDYDLEDPDEDSDGFDVEDDDVDIENFSGSDFDSPGSDEE